MDEFQARKNQGKQSYHSVHKYSRRKPVSNNATAFKTARVRGVDSTQVDRFDLARGVDDVSCGEEVEDRSLLKRLSMEYLQKEKLPSSAINISIREMDLDMGNINSHLDVAVVAAKLSTLPLFVRIGLPRDLCDDTDEVKSNASEIFEIFADRNNVVISELQPSALGPENIDAIQHCISAIPVVRLSVYETSNIAVSVNTISTSVDPVQFVCTKSCLPLSDAPISTAAVHEQDLDILLSSGSASITKTETIFKFNANFRCQPPDKTFDDELDLLLGD